MKYKLLVVIPSFYPAVVFGGPIFSSLYVCQNLSRLGALVKVCTTNSNMTSRLSVSHSRWLPLDGFVVRYYNQTFLDKLSLDLLARVWIHIYRSDIVHIQGIFNFQSVIALFYSRLFGKRTMLSPRGALGSWCLANGSRYKSAWLKYLVKPFANFVLWHATSTQEKAEIKKLFPDANVKVVPNGTDLSAFDSAKFMSKLDYFYKFTGRNGYPNKVVVSMGRIQKKKGFDILIRSFQLLLKDFPGSVLLIAGGDEGEKEYLESIVSDLSIDNSVCFVGAISGQDKVDFLHNADLFVLPSHNENFGNVFLESLAAGTPIVASLDTPWAIVEQYGCGRWVKNDVISTYAAIKDMLVRDPKDLSTKSRLLARQYSWESVAERFNKIFIDMKSRLDIG